MFTKISVDIARLSTNVCKELLCLPYYMDILFFLKCLILQFSNDLISYERTTAFLNSLICWAAPEHNVKMVLHPLSLSLPFPPSFPPFLPLSSPSLLSPSLPFTSVLPLSFPLGHGTRYPLILSYVMH